MLPLDKEIEIDKGLFHLLLDILLYLNFYEFVFIYYMCK